jgi:hypothetical protein
MSHRRNPAADKFSANFILQRNNFLVASRK